MTHFKHTQVNNEVKGFWYGPHHNEEYHMTGLKELEGIGYWTALLDNSLRENRQTDTTQQ
jgi:hypothetical protein